MNGRLNSRNRQAPLWRRLEKDASGATIIEFAVIAPFLFLMILGVIEFALMYATMSVLESSTARVAREQKALAGLSGGNISADEVRSRIVANSSDFLKEDKLTIWVSPWVGWGSTYDHVDGWGKVGEAEGDTGFVGTIGSSGNVSNVVQYEIYYAHHFYIPYVARMIGSSNVWDTTDDGKGIVLHANIVVQNEPPLL